MSNFYRSDHPLPLHQRVSAEASRLLIERPTINRAGEAARRLSVRHADPEARAFYGAVARLIGGTK